MCGVCGIVGFGDRTTVDRMAMSLAHRGPDDTGVCFFPEERTGLGHRRLSIIDLSLAGHQPMSTADDDVWIVYNGEIYNHLALRRDAELLGHCFRSRTDTEVILHYYSKEGIDSIRQLNGMFAFAILDRRRQKLLLVRDRLGIKPLYYFRDGTRFAFGSEIKAILAAGIYSPDLNWQGLHDYFTYLYVPCPDTIFKGIFQVPPAHVLELNLKTGEIRTWRYWRADVQGGQAKEKGNTQESYETIKWKLRNLLAQAVQSQMISDVPLGVLLSGGVDSPILAGLMAQASSRPVKTFTIIFHGKNVQYYNEQAQARAVADKLGTEHHEIAVDISDPMKMLRLVDYFDQPFGNPTFYLMYLIAQRTRPEVTVALSGAGGDELFAGYPRYRAIAIANWLRWLPSPLLNGTRWLLDRVPDDYRGTTLGRARRLLEGLDEDFARQFVKWTYFFDEEQKRSLLTQKVRTRSSQRNGFLPSDRVVRHQLEGSSFEDFGNRVLHLDTQTFLPDNLLEYTDKMSMAVGLEVRVPYLDHRVVEYSFSIPFHDKLRMGKSKFILKDAFGDLLPRTSRKGGKKGFNAPLAIWMRDHLDRYFGRNMTRESVEQEGIFNWEYIQMLRQQHRTGRCDRSCEIFSIIMFDVWYRKYMLQQKISLAEMDC